VLTGGQRAHGADQQPVLLERGLALGLDQPLGGLQHDGARRVERVVLAHRPAVGAEGLDLGDDVEVASGAELDVDVHERLQPGAEA
jgi:hypothetical protein